MVPQLNSWTGRPWCHCSRLGCHGGAVGHLKFNMWIYADRLKNWARSKWHDLARLDYSQLTDLELDGIDMQDYPDFCDSYISAGCYKGRPLTEAQLDVLNQDADFVYSQVMIKLY